MQGQCPGQQSYRHSHSVPSGGGSGGLPAAVRGCQCCRATPRLQTMQEQQAANDIHQGYRGGWGAGAGAVLPWPMTLAPTVVPRLCVPSDSPLQRACTLISQSMQAIRMCPHGSENTCAAAATLDGLARSVMTIQAAATYPHLASPASRRGQPHPWLLHAGIWG